VNDSVQHHKRTVWLLILCAAAILMITMGARQTTGLFVSPLNTATGLGIVAISFALAVSQFVWGAAQPVLGAISDKFGPGRVLAAGGILLALGCALTPYMQTQWGLVLTLGLMTAAGAGAGSFSVLIGAAAQRLPAERRSFASGLINAGGSLGQFVFAPLLQFIIGAAGWVAAMMTMAVVSLLTIPLAWPLRRQPVSAPQPAAAAEAAPAAGITLRRQLAIALRDPSYLYLNAGFFTCGFHTAFLVTHLPGEVQLCGLPATVASTSLAVIGLFNVVGSLSAGALGERYRMKNLLALVYGSRALIIVLYLLAPKTPLTFYMFAAGLGFTWLATVPPTAGLVGKLYGTRYLATLFGITLLSHQVGGFLGAWLGGIALDRTGSFDWMWYADIALAAGAALINLPIREPRVSARMVPA
jgi:predicted MFS family arabinose efflux permease